MDLPDIEYDRARLGWWLFVAVLFAAAVFIAHSFVGMISLGVFGYYATRPVYRRIDGRIDSDRVAAGLTVALAIVPIVLVALYTAFRVFQQVQRFLGSEAGAPLLRRYFNVEQLTEEQGEFLASLAQNPMQLLSAPGQSVQSALQMGMTVVSGVFGGILLIALAIAVSYFLLERQEQLSSSLLDLMGGHDTAAYAYAVAVDEDLESVFFGNLLFVVVMSVLAAAVYTGTNLLAPEGLHVPLVFALAFLTGVASLIPIVVGKVIYLPVVGYLGYQAVQTDASLTFVAGALVAYFLVLDILPQSLIQPYITGRQLDMLMMMFAYVLGPILFGWYGFFFLPIVFIVMLEAVRIVLPELLHGDPLTTRVSLGENVGTDPESEDDVAAEEPAGEEPPGGGPPDGSTGGTDASDEGDGSAAASE